MPERERVAREVAAEAVKVAQGVAAQAVETATKVAEIASETSKSMVVFAKDIEYIKLDVKDIKDKLDNKYVTVEAFAPVRNIVYGLMATLGFATLAALFKLIFIH